MALTIYNTLSRQKEEFKPIKQGHVGMYACGVTVYDDCHLGHARALINFDVVYRYLKYSGFKVNFVRNFTDIDDKIINRANAEKVAWDEISKRYIASFNHDVEGLKIHRPNLEPLATENIGEIIRVIEGLIKNDFAYQVGGDVLYSVRKKADYGKLSGKKIDELESGARIEVDDTKKDPLDFALWKSSKPGEPAWDSPWGKGRPGWHIECSAMSMRFLGETFDIHAGGRDLSFPHHENEIAQSEAFSGKPFANYWVHNGFVNINQEKMSKSLGNSLKIKDLLKVIHPEVLRLFVLSAHYRSPLDYTDKNMEVAKSSLDRWYNTIKRLKEVTPATATSALLAECENKILKLVSDFKDDMDDDFNSAKVVGRLFDLVRDINKGLDDKGGFSAATTKIFLDAVSKIHSVLGLFGEEPQAYLSFADNKMLAESSLTEEKILDKIAERKEARVAKNWKRSDEIRDELLKAGIKLKDNPDGTTSWSSV